MLKLWVATSPDGFSAEYDDIEEMFRRGLSRLILHKRGRTLPGMESPRDASAEDYERWLLSLSMEYRERIWVHGTPDTAERLDVRGCVFDAASFMGEVPECWKRVNCIAICRNPEDVLKLPEWVAGALVGPVFQPNSAIEPMQTVAMDSRFGKICNETRVPLIFWGGMEPETLQSVSGFSPSGVAVLGGIWNYADPVNAFIKMQRACAR